MAGDQPVGKPEAVGPFRLVSELGVGPLGNVYLGQSAGGRLVTVKIIRPDLSGDLEFRERFAREVAAARRVGGLFTAEVVDADVEGPPLWLASAYVPGPSLDRVVAENGPLPVESVRKLAADLAEGLRQIHAAGVVHRDLKPSNVLMSDAGPRIIDFGIARIAEASALTSPGHVVGSPEYMSPEQALGRQAGPASDVFSLGAVLFYAATGERPFGDGPLPSQMYRLVNELPQLDRVPTAIRPLIERALAKQPDDRLSLAEFEESASHSGPGEDPGFAEPGGVPTQPRIQSASSSGRPEDARRALGRRGREKLIRNAAPSPKFAMEAASRDREEESRPSSSSRSQLRKLPAQILSWLIPHGAMAVLRADHQAQQDEALQYVEAEIDHNAATQGAAIIGALAAVVTAFIGGRVISGKRSAEVKDLPQEEKS